MQLINKNVVYIKSKKDRFEIPEYEPKVRTQRLKRGVVTIILLSLSSLLLFVPWVAAMELNSLRPVLR